MAWREGEQVGPYTLESQLGQGGMATVYKAYHAQLDRYVAIKVMHQNFLDDATFVARFRREAQLVARLEHPHIVPVYDFDEYDGQPYLVMKYVQGQTLKHKLIMKPLTLDEILHVMTAVGGALTYAHERDVLHRDIKPSNVVIDKANVVYLADFGLARLASSGESTMSADVLLGTPHYISPEQARGEKNLDGRTDIYSLGVVLYELLVGHVPYTGDTPYSIIHDHIYTPLPEPTRINPEIPLAVEAVLYRALEKNRDDRYSTADDLVADLRSAIAESNLTELSPDRASMGAVSWAQAREAAVPNLQTPVGIPTPQQSATPGGLRTATLKKKPAAWYQGERIWPVGGCATFLLICFISCGVLLNMSANLQELMALSPDDSIHGEFALAEGVPPELLPLGIQLEEIGDYPVYSAPVLPIEFVQAIQADNPEQALVYLSLARSLWADDKQTAAREAITTGGQYAEDKIQYTASAAVNAQTAGDSEAALVYWILALHAAMNNPDVFELLRPTAGEFIYNTVGSVNVTNFDNPFRDVIGSDSFIAADSLNTSPVVLFAAARSRIANGNTVLALRTLRNVDENSAMQPEFMLLKAELEILQRNRLRARETLNAILEGEAPDWVINRADSLLNELER